MIIPLLPLLLGAATTTAAASSCAVCTCLPPGDAPLAERVADAASSADAVFSGRVVRIDQVEDLDDLARDRARSWDRQEVTLAVEERWKGAVGDSAVIVTSMLAEMCGADLDDGERYLVYAWRTPQGELATGRCSRTARIDRAGEDLRVLDDLRRRGLLREQGDGTATP